MISRQKLNVLFLIGNQGVNYLMPLLVLPFLMRILGPHKFGQLSFSLATLQFLVLLTDYGFNYSATKSISMARQDQAIISAIYARTLWAKLILCFFSLLALLILLTWVEAYAEIRTLLLINFLAVVGTAIYPIWLFQGMEKMGAITVFSVLSRALVLLLFYFLVKSESDMHMAMALLAVPNLLAGVCALLYIRVKGLVAFATVPLADIKGVFYEGAQVFSSTLLTSMYTLMTPIVVGFVAGPVSVGYLNVANTVKQAVCGLFSPLVQAYFPRVNALYVDDKKASVAIAMKLLKAIVLVMLAISLVMFFMSGFIIDRAFGVKYAAAVPVMRVLAFAPLFIMANSIMGLFIMIPRGDMRGYLSSIFAGAVVSLAIVFPAVYWFKETGGAMTLLLVEVVVAAFMLFRIYRYKIN